MAVEPEMPQDVFLVAPNGEAIPCILMHVGWKDGSAVWEAMPSAPVPGIETVGPRGEGLGMQVGMLPAATQIIMSIPREPDPR